MTSAETPKKRRRLPIPEIKPVSRRAFLRTSWLLGLAGGVGAFGAASVGFLWPNLGGGFGAAIKVDNAERLLSEIQTKRAPFAFPSGRMYIVAWDPSVPGAQDAYGEEHQAVLGPRAGLMAIYQKCVHLGCRVPWCQTAQWFECPCHGSKYNRWGEWNEGPAPRGLDRFPSILDVDGDLVVDTGALITGPARTAKVLAQEPEGPHCIDL